MTGILVDPNATCEIKVFFRDIVPEGQPWAYDVELWLNDTPPPDPENWSSITCHFRQVDHESFSNILEEATIINHVSQRPILRLKVLREYVLLTYLVSWDLGEDGKGGHPPEETLPITQENIQRLFFKVANLLFSKFMIAAGLLETIALASPE